MGLHSNLEYKFIINCYLNNNVVFRFVFRYYKRRPSLDLVYIYIPWELIYLQREIRIYLLEKPIEFG